MATGDEDLLTTQETLALLGVSRTTLYAIIREGILKPVEPRTVTKRTPRNLYRRADVERLLREGRKPPTPPARDANGGH